MNSHFALAPLVLALVACGPSIKPAMKAATDAKLSSYASDVQVGPPASYEPREWTPGQWIAYRVTQKDKPPAVTTVKVIAQDAEGIWLETESQDYYSHSITKALYRRMPRTAEEAMDALVKVVIKTDDEPAQEMDFRQGPMAEMMKQAMKFVAAGVTAPTDVGSLPKETVTVPAGTFQGAAKFTGQVSFGPITKTVSGWFHPAVPLNGSVRSITSDGEISTDLIAYGETGATSSLK